MIWKKSTIGKCALGAALLVPATAFAEDTGVSQGVFVANNVWMMVCTAFVFIMHLGFASVETGLTRAKNTTNILFKNVFVICSGLLTYYICGFNLMYPGDFNGYFGFAGFGLDPGADGNTALYADGGYTYWTDFIFQGMFAATCATIVSGAVAERIKLSAFMIFALVFVAIIYPIAGSWKWGGGWLDAMGFYDFAGSTLVHSVGGWGALVGAWMLGGRLGKFGPEGRLTPIPGSNMPLAAIGVFLLWLGWFGFNAGSAVDANAAAVNAFVATHMCAAAGMLGWSAVEWIKHGKPSILGACSGAVAGLVCITPASGSCTAVSAIPMGIIAGVVCYFACVKLKQKCGYDDSLDAFGVHGVGGTVGALLTGVFASKHLSPGHYGLLDGMPGQMVPQIVSIVATAVFALIGTFIILKVLDAVMGLRVSQEDEVQGLDVSQHGEEGYIFL